MGAQKTWLGSLFFVSYVLRSGIENDECMATGMEAVEGLPTPLLPRYMTAVIQLCWAFSICLAWNVMAICRYG